MSFACHLLHSTSKEHQQHGMLLTAKCPTDVNLPCAYLRIENGKIFEELAVDAAIAEERSWREKTDIDVHQGIYRDPKSQTIVSMR